MALPSPSTPSGHAAAVPSPGRRVGRRLLALGLGLLVALALLEGGLRLTGWWLLEERATAEHGGGPTWLCVGDSNVYGLWVGADESYPAALQRRVGSAARVVNAGLPGLNSRSALANLPEQLDAHAPELVLLTVGANNSWTWGSGSGFEYTSPPWYESLKVVRLVRLLVQRFDSVPSAALPDEFDATPQLARGDTAELVDRSGRRVTLHEGDGSRSALSESEVVETLRRDVAAAAGLVRGAGARLVLVTYGADDGIYAPANAGLGAAASELGLLLVEPEPALAALAAERGFDAVYFHDLHPRPLGYAAVAAEVARRLASAGAWPVGAPQPEPGLGPGIAPGLEAASTSTSTADGAEIALTPEGHFALSHGAPGRRFRLLVWGARVPGAPSPITTRADQEADPLYVASQHSDLFLARFDERGEARLDLGEFLAGPLGAALRGHELSACTVLLSETGAWTRVGPTRTVRVP